MSGQGPPSQGGQGNNSDKEEREWSLKDCTMEIASMGKKDSKDEFMTIDLIFKMDDDPTPKIVGKLRWKALNIKILSWAE